MDRWVKFNGKWNAHLKGNIRDTKDIKGIIYSNDTPFRFQFDGMANCTYNDGFMPPKTIHIKLCYACMAFKKYIHAEQVAQGLVIYPNMR